MGGFAVNTYTRIYFIAAPTPMLLRFKEIKIEFLEFEGLRDCHTHVVFDHQLRKLLATN
jgi:hypothetical protein